MTSARLIVVLMLLGGASCRTSGRGTSVPIVQPGAPGAQGRVIGVAAASDLSKVRFTPADVRFMQGMIGHHAQAVEMVALLATRTRREDMKLLAKRIELSQVDEMAMMRQWLEARHQSLPDPHAHHVHAAALMPGMLTPEQMAALGQASGGQFDRLFLEGMIRHHEGALTMVQELFATAGAGQESEIYAFASDVDADQRMEIDRMRGMLNVQ